MLDLIVSKWRSRKRGIPSETFNGNFTVAHTVDDFDINVYSYLSDDNREQILLLKLNNRTAKFLRSALDDFIIKNNDAS